MELSKTKWILGNSTQILFLFLLFTIPSVSFGDSLRNTLMCYQCVIQGKNEYTCDNDLRICPDDQAYDRCMINVIKNETTGDFIIIKRCALAPCEFDMEVEKTLGFTDKCILSRRDPDCVKCCIGDGCNKRATESLAHQLGSTSYRLQSSITPFLQLGILIQVIRTLTCDTE